MTKVETSQERFERVLGELENLVNRIDKEFTRVKAAQEAADELERAGLLKTAGAG